MDDDKTEGEDLGSTETAQPQSPILPKRVGPYRILERLGEGGMGVVYLAEQTEPVRRRVALKVIKRGMDTDQVVARFEAERQALAMMDHPCVAKVFDAGSTSGGRPYFAMEYVQGVPITEHCDRQRLTTRERLELFQQVCEGVQHAHQNAIIHRDLKPSNVLVSYRDGKAAPKIIDFGVAKATAHRLTEKTLFTAMGVLIGTPEYMSPEQAEMTGQNVDTRTDVYSLGVVLYELLVGALPFESKELRQAGFDEIRRKIREDEPSKPSTRISTLGDDSTNSASKRRTDPTSLSKQLRGDLDWITMKALAKDRGRRYGSPAELAADVERHLTSQPVLAGPPSAVYRTRKFVGRHRVGAGVAASGVLVLLAFAVTMTVQAGRIARERDRANREALVATQTSEFLENLFEVSDPDEARGSEVTARELLDKGAEQIQTTPFDDAEVQARLLGTMGRVYRQLGHYEQAEPLLRRGLELRQSRLGADHPDTLSSMNHLAILLGRRGHLDEAEALLLEAVDIRRRTLGTDHVHTLWSMTGLASIYLNQGFYDQAEPLYLEALESQQRVLGDDHPDTLATANNLAILYKNQARYDEAERLYVQTLETKRRVLGDDHPGTLSSMQNLANLYSDLGRYAEAEPLYIAALETQKRVLGDDHPGTLSSINSMAVLHSDLGRDREAESLYLESLEGRRRVLGIDHPHTLGSMVNLAVLYKNQGQYERAETLYVEALETQRRVRGDDHRETLSSMFNLAVLYAVVGRSDEAEALHLEALEGQRRSLGKDHPDTIRVLGSLADLYAATGRPDQARPIAAEFLSGSLRRAEASSDPQAKNGYAWTALTIEPADLRDPESALRLALEANELTGFRNPNFLDTLSLAFHLTGETRRAVENQKKALALLPDGESAMRASLEATLANFEAALQADSN